jgi:pimeloyl-ACP methyl ester carboxylesterase
MKVHFKDELFDAQLLRALSHAYYGGADIGECLTTAQRIRETDAESWYGEWLDTADRIEAAGDACLAKGHRVSAREAFLRASNYHRTASIFLLGLPLDPRLVQAYERQAAAFGKAAALFSPAIEPVAIPYANTTLPGYFVSADNSGDDSGQPRQTLILTGGYDGTAEELYFFNAAAAARRGYNCLFFDGPGQGGALIKQGLHIRPDWENVITPVLDYVLTRPTVDPNRVALMGLSFGGYLAPRAASREHRLAACIADPGEFDLFAAVTDRMPPVLAHQLPHGNAAALGLLKGILDARAHEVTGGWGLRRGMLVHGVTTPLDYVLACRDFTMEGYAEHIRCPTLVCFADHDEVAAYAQRLYDALTCPKDFVSFTAAEGAGEHCESGNRSLFHQRVFDWLDERFGRS